MSTTSFRDVGTVAPGGLTDLVSIAVTINLAEPVDRVALVRAAVFYRDANGIHLNIPSGLTAPELFEIAQEHKIEWTVEDRR